MGSFATAGRFTTDNVEEVRVSGSGGGGGNVNITGINGVAPALNNPLPVELSDGTNAFGTASNPLNTNSALKKTGTILTSTPLAGNGTFTSAWFDTATTGDAFVAIMARADQAGANPPGFRIEGTDDTANANFTHQLAFYQNGNLTGYGINTSTMICANITTRFWRVIFVNGITAQGSFELTAATSAVFNPAVFPGYTSAGVSQSTDTNQHPPQVASFSGSNLLYALSVGLGSVSSALTDGASNTTVVGAVNGGNGNPIVGQFVTLNNVFNGATWDRLRTPSIFKTVTVAATAAGNTAVWTPTAGKKFRLMGFNITAQGLAATATAAITVSFQDAAVAMPVAFDVDVPAVAGVVSGITQVSGGLNDYGNGILSAAANNVLNFNISAAGAGTVGTYRINVIGTEE